MSALGDRVGARPRLSLVSEQEAQSFPLPQPNPSGYLVAGKGRYSLSGRLLFTDEHTWVSAHLLVQVRRFKRVTVITPSGMIGRYEWRQLANLIRREGPERCCVLDLVFALRVHPSALFTVLPAHRQRRYRGVPFLLWNLPPRRRRWGVPA